MSRHRMMAKEMPDETQPRIRALVEQSAPDPDRPLVDPEIERKFEPIERKTAACYANMENNTVQLQKIARDIEKRKTPANGTPIKGAEK